MKFLNIIIACILFCFTYSMYSQEGYNAKKEYVLNNRVKVVKTYAVNVGRYIMPTDTLEYFSKTVLAFTAKGDLKYNKQFLNQPSYSFKSISNYTGSGKNISYVEESVINDTINNTTNYQYEWVDNYNYRIKSAGKNEIRSVSLNPDFSIKSVSLESDNYVSVEDVSYHYKENNVLDYIIYQNKIDKEGITDISNSKHEIKEVDIYNNPTVIYFYKNLNVRVPAVVLFKYYEYY